MKILIAEDEAIIAESLFQVLLQLDYDPFEPAGNSAEALHLLENEQPEMAIVDIHLGEPFSGFEVAKALQIKKIPFIFLTALYDKDTVARAKEYNPSAYLVKPFTKENLFATIELTKSQTELIKQNSDVANTQLFIKHGNKHLALDPLSILYLEADGKYVLIHCDKNKKHFVRITLNELMEQLTDLVLVQVHKSFVVNPLHIKAIKYDELMINEISIPIGRTYRDALKKDLAFLK